MRRTPATKHDGQRDKDSIPSLFLFVFAIRISFVVNDAPQNLPYRTASCGTRLCFFKSVLHYYLHSMLVYLVIRDYAPVPARRRALKGTGTYSQG